MSDVNTLPQAKPVPFRVTSSHMSDLECAALNNPAMEKILNSIKENPGIEVVPQGYNGWTSDLSVSFMYPEEIKLFD